MSFSSSEMSSRHLFFSTNDAVVVETDLHSKDKTAAWSKIKNYLSEHKHLLKAKDVSALKELKKQTLSEYKNDSPAREEITQLFNSLIDSLKDATSHVEEVKVVCRISPPPKDLETFAHNLELFSSHYPRYQFGNSLEVLDTNSYRLPQDWDPALVLTELDRKIQLFQKDPRLAHVDLQKACEVVRKAYKEKVFLTLGMINETEADATAGIALYIFAENFIKEKRALIVNLNFLKIHSEKLAVLIKNHSFDIYIQPQGGLGVLLPSQKNLSSMGFKSEKLQKWEHDFNRLPNNACQYADDIKNLLSEDSEGIQYLRLMAITGHGDYPKKSYHEKGKDGLVAGFSIEDFQKQLEVLNSYNMAACVISSCYVGGVNASKIHLPDKTISCPTVLLSSLENTAVIISGQTPQLTILNEFEREFSTSQRKGYPVKQINKKRLSEMFKSFSVDCLYNIPSVFFQKNRADIPVKMISLLGEQSGVLDVSKIGKKSFVDSLTNRSVLYFSEPIINKSITLIGGMAFCLLSGGSNTYHIIDELNCPDKSIEDIGKITFNILMNAESKSPVIKVFFIRKMECQLTGISTKLSHIMIKSSPKDCQILFKMEGRKEFNKLNFAKNNQFNWIFTGISGVSEDVAILQIYESIHQSDPSDETLSMMNGGKLDQKELLEVFNNTFWDSSIPKDAEIISTILYDSIVFTPSKNVQSTHLEQLMEDVIVEFNRDRSNPELIWKMRAWIDFGVAVDRRDKANFIREISYTPLMKAVISENYDEVKNILDVDDSTVNATQVNGSTALHLIKSEEVTALLLERGADPSVKNRYGQSPVRFTLQADLIQALQLMLKDSRVNIRGEEGVDLLRLAFQLKKEEFAFILMENLAGVEEDITHLLFAVPGLKNEAYFLSKFLTYPKINLEHTVGSLKFNLLQLCASEGCLELVEILLNRNISLNKLDALDRSILSIVIEVGIGENRRKIIDLLIERGADLNTVNKEGLSTLGLIVTLNEIDLIDPFLSHGARLDLAGDSQKNALEIAFESNQAAFDKITAHSSFKVNLLDGKGLSPFTRALRNENLKLAQQLVYLGASVDVLQGDLKPPIISYLSHKKHLSTSDAINLLLSHKVDLLQSDQEGNTVLHYAAFLPMIEMEQIIQKAPSLLHRKNNAGHTPLIALAFAMKENHLIGGTHLDLLMQNDSKFLDQDLRVVLEILGEHPSFPEKKIYLKAFHSLTVQEQSSPQYAFHKAIIEKNTVNIIKLINIETPFLGFSNLLTFLLFHCFPHIDLYENLIIEIIEAGCDVQSANPGGLTPLKIFVSQQSIKCVNLLLKKDIDANMIVNNETSNSKINSLPFTTIKLIGEKGGDLKGKLGKSLLRGLLLKKLNTDQKKSLKYLLSVNAGSDIKNESFLYQAIMHDCEEVTKIVLEHPATNVNELRSNDSPLKLALRKQNIPLLKQLLEKGAYPNGNKGDSVKVTLLPLFEVIFLRGVSLPMTIEMFNLLLDHGANINSKDKDENSLLHAAVSANNLKLATFFLGKGIKKELRNAEGKTALDLAQDRLKGDIYELIRTWI